MKNQSLIAFYFLFSNTLIAQHQLVSNGGAAFTTPSVQLSISIGEPVAVYGATAGVHLSQGYQQGYVESVLSTELIDFKAVRVSFDSVELHISLENKNHLQTLKIQKSVNGKAFSNLKIASKTIEQGHVMDFNNTPFPTYYRLEIVDNMGKTTYSIIRVVEGITPSVHIMPNPVNDVLTLIFDKNNIFTNIFIEILNNQGQVLLTKTFSKSEEKIQFDVSNLPTGLYFCRFNNLPTTFKFYKN